MQMEQLNGICCSWSQTGPDPGREVVPGPGVRGPAEHQGKAGGWEHTFHRLLEEGEHDAPDQHFIQSVQKIISCMTVVSKAEVNNPKVLSVKAAEVEQEVNKKLRDYWTL